MARAVKERRRARRHLSLLELGVVTALVAVLIGVGLQRMQRVMGIAERARLTGALANLQTALNVRAFSAIIAGREAELTGGASALEEREAGALMLKEMLTDSRYHHYRPLGYAGALDDPGPAEVSEGSWYYDLRRGLLVYRVEHEQLFRSPLPGPPRARFAVRTDYTDRDGDGRFSPGVDGFHGAHLQPVEPYRWLTESGN